MEVTIVPCVSYTHICKVKLGGAFLHCGHYMYHQFNIHKFHVLSTQNICFFMDIRTNSDYFPTQY